MHQQAIVERKVVLVDHMAAQQRRQNLYRVVADRLRIREHRALTAQGIEVRQRKTIRAIFKHLVIRKFVKDNPHQPRMFAAVRAAASSSPTSPSVDAAPASSEESTAIEECCKAEHREKAATNSPTRINLRYASLNRIHSSNTNAVQTIAISRTKFLVTAWEISARVSRIT